MISEFPVFMFTLLAGAAAGAYLPRAIFEKAKAAPTKTIPSGHAEKAEGSPSRSDSSKNAWVFPLICLAIIAVGVICVIFHVQHPERVMNAINNPGASLTQEGIFSGILGLLILVDLIYVLVKKTEAPRGLIIVTAIVGVAFIVVMAHAYVTCWGNRLWAQPATWALFIAGDLALGWALYEAVFNRADSPAIAWVNVALQMLAACSFAWEAATFANGDFQAAAFVAAALFAACAAVVQVAGIIRKQSKPSSAIAWGVLILSLIGVVIARYAFYAVGLYLI